MTISFKNCLSGNQLKLIAIFAMTVDHLAWAIFPGYPTAPLPLLMHLFGRITCPIMCFFIAEGYHYTRDINRYTARLFLFAVPSHFCYLFSSPNFTSFRSFLPFSTGVLNQTSVMWSLAWGLMMLRVVHSEKIRSGALRVLCVLLICLVSFPSDWSCIAAMCVLAFGTNRGISSARRFGCLPMSRHMQWFISLPLIAFTAFCKWALSSLCHCFGCITESAEKARASTAR